MVVSKTKALETKIGELRVRDLGASCFVFETNIKKKSINKLPLVSINLPMNKKYAKNISLRLSRKVISKMKRWGRTHFEKEAQVNLAMASIFSTLCKLSVKVLFDRTLLFPLR